MGWSKKYKKSINCNNPKGFSQKAHCAGKKKRNENIMKLSELKEQIKNMIQERSINAISKAQQKNASDIEKALDFYKKNKHTDKKEAFIKVLKKLGDEKKKLEKEMDIAVSSKLKNVGLSDKFESVNEMQVVNKKTGKDITRHVLDLLKGKIDKKKFEKLTGLKKESVNESTGFDSRTGLFYLSGVPFTKERMVKVISFFKLIPNIKSAVNQFEFTPSLIVKDKTGREEVLITSKKLKMLVDFYKKNKAKLASDKDF